MYRPTSRAGRSGKLAAVRILAFDTSTPWLSVALRDGERVLARTEHAGHGHSARLVPVIDAMLAESGLALTNLDAIAFGAGPGAFTGVRIACGVAQGLALGADLPLVAVSTLEALAHTAWRTLGATQVVACLDARMREVYVAAYVRDRGAWREEHGPAVLAPGLVVLPRDARSWLGAGDGFAAYPELASTLGAVDVTVRPDGRAIADLAVARVAAGDTLDAADALPLYVRHRVALTTAERHAGQRM